MKSLLGLSLSDIQKNLAPFEIPDYRANQIAEWIYKKGASSFDDMTNLPKSLRVGLAKCFSVEGALCVNRLDSRDGLTSKFLLEFSDGVAVETVLMRQPYGNSVCVSTQAGCAMGCAFCASTVHGVARNLTAAEMVSEVIFVENFLRQECGKVNTVVLMGSGEPMMNYGEVMDFLRIIHDESCMGLGYRSVTLSTSGIVPGIKNLAKENIPVTLSVSLHAPYDDLRSSLMPVNKKYPLGDVLDAAGEYAAKTGRRVTYEYILIRDVNDGEAEARALAELIRGQLANVNLIPINPVKERDWKRPSLKRVGKFLEVLEGAGIGATVRKEMGADIKAACGQLRNSFLKS